MNFSYLQYAINMPYDILSVHRLLCHYYRACFKLLKELCVCTFSSLSVKSFKKTIKLGVALRAFIILKTRKKSILTYLRRVF